MGNFTTAYVAKYLGRYVCGFELNKDSFNHHIKEIDNIQMGEGLKYLKKVENIQPENQGKPITSKEKNDIVSMFQILKTKGNNKKDSIEILCKEFGRGYFGIVNILNNYNY